MATQLNKLTDKSIKETNKFRKSIGLKPIELKQRECIRCGNIFISHGPGHRLCMCVNNMIYEHR